MILQGARTPERDRADAFSAFAERRAAGEVLVPPTLLDKEARRLHVRRTLREDHQFRILNRPEGAQSKFDKLAADPFDFFRGSALLYYRDLAGTDAHLPVVFTLGDIHPENFGVMPNEDNTPVFGVNDFDEAFFAPFSYDVKRGAVGFYIAAKENGLKKKERKAVVRAFVEGYFTGLQEMVKDDREQWHEYRIDNSPPLIRDLLKGSLESRKSFLDDKVDFDSGTFRPTEEIVPHSAHCEEFQDVIDDYVKANDVEPVKGRDGYFTVRDVAIKKGSGTASLGLDRFWVLVEGPSEELKDAVLLELKQARRSVLYGLVPPNDVDEPDDEAANVVYAQQVHLVGGDALYGRVEIEDQPFIVRERSPYKDDIDVDELDADALRVYAAICGKALAQPHARSDEGTGVMEGDAEARILEAVNVDVFVGDVVRFAHRTAKRVYKDWKLFKKDHKLGAFEFFRPEEPE